MELNKIYQGSALEVLKTLPDESINTCVTSPPYFGLRDYGTAKWCGGDADCDHSGAKMKSRYDYSLDTSPIQDGSRTGTDAPRYKNECPDCGAKRIDDQVGIEETPEAFVQSLVDIFREIRRVLKDDGTAWLNLGDTYYNFRGYGDYQSKQTIANHDGHVMNTPSGKRNSKLSNLKGKDLIGIPWMVAFALRADGWYLRQDIIWHKPNPMPESVTDRCTKAHEYIFLLSKNKKYYYDADAIRENIGQVGIRKGAKVPLSGVVGEGRNDRETFMDNKTWDGRNKRSVWTVTTKPFKEAHFATFPEDLIEPCVLAGCPEGGVVLDPFIGSGTTAIVAMKHGRNYVGIDLNPSYIDIADKRMQPVKDKISADKQKAETISKFFK